MSRGPPGGSLPAFRRYQWLHAAMRAGQTRWADALALPSGNLYWPTALHVMTEGSTTARLVDATATAGVVQADGPLRASAPSEYGHCHEHDGVVASALLGKN